MNIKLLIAAVICCMPILAYADSFEVNGIVYNPISDTEAEVTEGDSFGIEYTGEIVIPEQVTHEGITYNVVAVGDYAFYHCDDLTSVVIPEGVTIIGNAAFRECENLSSVVVPESVKKIGDSAFENTPFYSNLPYGEVYLGSVLYSYKIDHNSYDNPGNTRVEVKEGTTYISPYAFERVHDVTSIIIPETVTEIGEFAFAYSGLTELSISDSETIVGEWAIYDTPYYENLPDGVIYLGSALYKYKGNMPENTSIAVKDGTKSISNEAFQSQINLISVTLPEGIAYIGRDAFFECENLTTINIPDGVTSIGWFAFSGCKSLTSINIPNSVTSIGGAAFENCTSLTSINIPDGVTSIGGGIFANCTSLTSINIPNAVTTIGEAAFFGCSSLTSINIPNSVTSIGGAAFANCTSLTSINIPNGVSVIEYGTFENCTSLTSINLPKTLVAIKDLAFCNCSNLESEMVLKNVTEIGDGAFEQCKKLSSITLNDNLIYIGLYAFDGTAFYNNLPDGIVYLGKVLYKHKGVMSENTSISVKEGTTCITGYAFRDCDNLIAINIPETVNSIGRAAFFRCGKLESIDIPNGVTNLGESILSGCSSLRTLTIPGSVTNIFYGALNGCSSLEHIYNHAQLPAICDESEQIFDGVPVDTCVLHVPIGCVDAYKAADCWKNFVNIVGDQAGIEKVESSESAETEYFDLRGRKVTEPTNGIFIKKQGKNTSKVLL